ncbi:PTS sugar transporter subunit IIA [Luteolibacter pohnpeiensis]|uniref:PTS sugar transporter subunit IIA n=1 Tax=Luteolibacter pohnpeiensis TaxID=454153 RepID=A0A934S587_9BACT|nr:PTS sugar transporter subunit IIA [Luteolibacter pohnpeiensis]MBK1881490.1 PTS sugar transporter subunit IIA [Luteolibacter pohnpeiensis]
MKLDSIPEFLKSEYLTIGLLAANLGWSVRFIEGLVRGERLPGLEINGAWHFRRDDVIDWLEQKIQTLDANRVIQLERRIESSLASEGIYQSPLTLDRIASRLPDEGIELDAPIHTKNEVIHALTGLAERTGLLFDRDYLLAALLDRESLCSTAMPGGVALCHPRRPIPTAISTQFMCFLRTANPVPFGSDDELTDGTTIFFLLCAPDDRSHLYGLARIARMLHHGILSDLRSAKNKEELKAVIAQTENEIHISP